MDSTALVKSHCDGQLSQPCHFLELSVDLVEMIIDHLRNETHSKPEYVACLAVTCKSFYCIAKDIFRIKKPRDQFQLRPMNYFNFQKMWEKDFDGEMRYCVGCRRLVHRDHPQACGAMQHRFHPQLSAHDDQFLPIHACAVMNRDNSYASRDLPQSVLEQPSSTEWGSSQTMWHQKPTIKVIGDEMFLHIQHAWEGDQATFHKHVIREGYHICKHTNLSQFENARVQRQLSFKEGHMPVTGTCSSCGSDFKMSIESQLYIKPEDGLLAKHQKVTVDAYHAFGKCDRPVSVLFSVLLSNERSARHVDWHSTRWVKNRWEAEKHRLAAKQLQQEIQERNKRRRFHKKMMKAALKPMKRQRSANPEKFKMPENKRRKTLKTV